MGQPGTACGPADDDYVGLPRFDDPTAWGGRAVSKRGYSIVELLVVMGMTSVVLTVGLGMVHRVMHEQKAADRDNAMHRVAERLSTKLREDVHLANRAELIQPDDEGEQSLVLHQPGETTVTYAVRNHVLQRSSIREGEPAHRDSFPFPDDYRLQFRDVSARRVTFTAFALPQAYLATASGESRGEDYERDVRRAVMHVETSVGRDHRFVSETRESSEP
jgi:type II secretory pathway pseudopilin PulG